MNKTYLKTSILLAALTALAGTALNAQTVVYTVGKRQSFTQTGNTTVVGSGYGFFSVFSGDAGAFTDVTISNGSNQQTMVDVSAPGESFFEYINNTYSNKASLEAAWATATYTFAYSGGSLGSGQHDVAFFQSDFPPFIPGLTHNSWLNAQSVDANSDLLLTWLPAEWGPGPLETAIFVEIQGANGYTESFHASGDATQIIIPANTFSELSSYTVTIDFVRLDSIEDDGVFAGVAGYANTLKFDLHTIPEPSTIALLSGAFALAGAIVYRRRSNKAQA